MKTSLAVLVFALLPTLALAGGTMRCGSKIINEGTSQAKVEALCGKPAQITRPDHDDGASALNEIWTYNFGSSKQMQRVRFRGGLVVEIESVGRGY